MNLEKIGLSLKQIHFVRLAIVAILANLIVYAFINLPRQDRLFQLQSKHISLRSEIVAKEKEKRQLEQRLKDLKQAEVDLERIYNVVLMPRTTGVTDMRLELEEMASSLQVGKGFAYNYGQTSEFGLQPFTLSVPIQGSYRDIRNFINQIERSRHFLILDQVHLSSQKDANLLNLNFRISTYLTVEKKGT